MLELRDKNGKLLSDNFYWRNGKRDLDYTDINSLPDADVSVSARSTGKGSAILKLKNESSTVASFREQNVKSKWIILIFPLARFA